MKSGRSPHDNSGQPAYKRRKYSDEAGQEEDEAETGELSPSETNLLLGNSALLGASPSLLEEIQRSRTWTDANTTSLLLDSVGTTGTDGLSGFSSGLVLPPSDPLASRLSAAGLSTDLANSLRTLPYPSTLGASLTHPSASLLYPETSAASLRTMGLGASGPSLASVHPSLLLASQPTSLAAHDPLLLSTLARQARLSAAYQGATSSSLYPPIVGSGTRGLQDLLLESTLSPRVNALGTNSVLPGRLPNTSQSSRSEMANDNDAAGNGVRMSLPSDEDNLSGYQCLIRSQIEFFEAKEQDMECNAQGRNKPIVAGQVGIRCIACAAIPPGSRPRGAVYFPAKLPGLYQAAQNMYVFIDTLGSLIVSTKQL